MGDDKSVKDLAKQFKGLDTSGVEVDEEQVPPTIAAGSAEEAAELAKEMLHGKDQHLKYTKKESK